MSTSGAIWKRPRRHNPETLLRRDGVIAQIQIKKRRIRPLRPTSLVDRTGKFRFMSGDRETTIPEPDQLPVSPYFLM
jgi:hypothetical protein